jgi:hypothetical protein
MPLLRAAFEHASLGIAFYDRDLRFIAVNGAFAAISGVAAAGHEGRRLDEILPEHAAQIVPNLRSVFASGRPLTGIPLAGVRNQVVPRVGHWLATYEPVIKQDTVTAVVALMTEVTAQRLLIEEQRARKAAEEANHGKDEFVATLSHELRTPLNAVIGWTRVLRAGNGDPALTERALDAIERNAEAQGRLIADLLDIARITRGGLRLETSEIDLRVVALAALDAVGPMAEGKGLRLVADLPELAVPLAGDPTRLRQVMWNLLTNAVKFTPSGGEIRLHVRGLPDGAQVIVRDTGIGIPPEILPRIFDRYMQADPSRGGLGLGLAIASSVARLHGGSVRASSDGPGRGSQFELLLPAPRAAVAPVGDGMAQAITES